MRLTEYDSTILTNTQSISYAGFRKIQFNSDKFAFGVSLHKREQKMIAMVSLYDRTKNVLIVCSWRGTRLFSFSLLLFVLLLPHVSCRSMALLYC